MTPLNLNDWAGQQTQSKDILRSEPARFLQATLGREPDLQAGAPLPPLWHWLYFLEAKPANELGRDGHPKRGGFLPPVQLPRRMWAGGRFEFHVPLVLGEQVTRTSRIKNITEKQGRSGDLCFVTVQHEIFQSGDLALTEEHDIVYRADPDPKAPAPKTSTAPETADVSRAVTPSATLLFRYSALTFNGHRIHYDAEYARKIEGYDGLVFHGPLAATLLIDLAANGAQRTPRSFEFRALAPISGPTPFYLEAKVQPDSTDLWVRRADNVQAVTAVTRF